MKIISKSERKGTILGLTVQKFRFMAVGASLFQSEFFSSASRDAKRSKMTNHDEKNQKQVVIFDRFVTSTKISNLNKQNICVKESKFFDTNICLLSLEQYKSFFSFAKI
jgi:hypothetical protein